MHIHTFFVSFIVFITLNWKSLSCPVFSGEENCIQVNSWNDFQSIISLSTSNNILVFCPFQVIKSNPSWLIINKNITIACQQHGSCMITSTLNWEERLIRIQGNQSQISVSGFVFQISDLSTAAIHITQEAGLGSQQVFCACKFTRYVIDLFS